MTIRKGVQKIYSEVAETYELVNHVLTFGLDILWRRKTAKMAAQLGGTLWLDVCSGTGEMARSLSQWAEEMVQIFAVDFSYPMLAKAREKKHASNLFFTIAEAGELPFPDGCFDLVILSFATRNLNLRKDVMAFYLREFSRVLKPGGLFLNLETSQPFLKPIRKIFHLYVRFVVRPIGWLLSGSKAGYRYLSYTIPRFYNPEDFSDILRESGFSHVDFQLFLLGVSAIHVATK
jgi:demethylmenaquinone methyltransferase/2-methoxy-6-polyprenyl-1,4-benzoquinol methylase